MGWNGLLGCGWVHIIKSLFATIAIFSSHGRDYHYFKEISILNIKTMTFPCLVCGELPVVEQPVPQLGGSSRISTSNNSPVVGNTNGKKNGATIRTLSKDVSDKIFQNLCRHLYVKTEPYWFIQNPGEQMPLCAFCSGVVLEVYTLQTKMDQYQQMIKKLVWKLERIVADTEIATNWMATREEQESEEEMWNNIPCPPMAVRIARERHHKFRQQILLSK